MSIWAQLTGDTLCVVFDTETNGLFRKGSTNPRMVALAWSLFSIKKGSFRKRSFIVRADDFDPNPSGLLNHGIDKAKALQEGVPASHLDCGAFTAAVPIRGFQRQVVKSLRRKASNRKIPTGFRLKAQGCEARATLGQRSP
jgi:hypothetical protein